ncbi:hypothetical protein RUM43_007621, partial [Polyplax serrata]
GFITEEKSLSEGAGKKETGLKQREQLEEKWRVRDRRNGFKRLINLHRKPLNREYNIKEKV